MAYGVGRQLVNGDHELGPWDDGVSKTRGIAFGPGENELALDPEMTDAKNGWVVSGDDAYSTAVENYFTAHPEIERVRDFNGSVPTANHAEPKIAWWMRLKKVKVVDLVINNPKGVCNFPYNCGRILDSLLGKDQILRVWSPGRSTPERLLPHRRSPYIHLMGRGNV